MNVRKSKILQFPIIKYPLLKIYTFFWYIVRHLITNDKVYLSFVYWCRFHKRIDWSNPQTFNEKLQYLKLYKHKPVYTVMADKYAVKKYVAELIGEEYVVPCYGFWENAKEIDFTKLPNQFVLKCNHNSGMGRCICKDKDKLNIKRVRTEIQKGLNEDYYLPGRDKQYRDIPKKILAEKFLDDGTGAELRDYKFMCFHGEPKFMYCTNKGKIIYENFYDMNFQPIDIKHGFERLSPEISKPLEFDIMKKLARILSKNIPFVRVDFFVVDHHVYFSEFTFFDWGGLKPYLEDWDYVLGQLLDIKNV